MKKVMGMLAGALLVMATLGSLSGCSTLTGWWDDVRSDETLRLVVKESVETMIKTNPEYQDRALEIVAKVRSHVDASPMANAGEIVDLVRGEINWDNLNQDQTILLNTLLAATQTRIAEAIAEGEVKEDAEATVGQYLRWLEQTALEGKALSGAGG